MKKGDTIFLRPKNQPDVEPAEAVIEVIDDDQMGLRVEINKPPEWFRLLERKRGLFSNAPATLFLFNSSTGGWFNTQSLDLFEIVTK